ncbi:hypothetical protein SELMODRAFT_405775 [Selaginella moellendorffii]|uniref:Uncharacterized protein n=1 Tax=Selaginella moellendorffii TaxID=88036 RepID=D8QZN7_SELML|nr:hypothetical protein SELMODRAFT_405775 [Selaginella moellendorffii]
MSDIWELLLELTISMQLDGSKWRFLKITPRVTEGHSVPGFLSGFPSPGNEGLPSHHKVDMHQQQLRLCVQQFREQKPQLQQTTLFLSISCLTEVRSPLREVMQTILTASANYLVSRLVETKDSFGQHRQRQRPQGSRVGNFRLQEVFYWPEPEPAAATTATKQDVHQNSESSTFQKFTNRVQCDELWTCPSFGDYTCNTQLLEELQHLFGINENLNVGRFASLPSPSSPYWAPQRQLVDNGYPRKKPSDMLVLLNDDRN